MEEKKCWPEKEALKKRELRSGETRPKEVKTDPEESETSSKKEFKEEGEKKEELKEQETKEELRKEELVVKTEPERTQEKESWKEEDKDCKENNLDQKPKWSGSKL